jgi:hypothetical protein
VIVLFLHWSFFGTDWCTTTFCTHGCATMPRLSCLLFWSCWKIFWTFRSSSLEQQKRIDEQKEMISKQAHLAVQSIQEEQH